VIDQNAKVIDQSAKVIDQSAKVIDQNAKVIDQSAKVIDQNVKVIDSRLGGSDDVSVGDRIADPPCPSGHLCGKEWRRGFYRRRQGRLVLRHETQHRCILDHRCWR
jgi:hypothetical protein